MKKYVCEICGYVYDPEKGDPEHDIPAGTPFEKLPDDWTCPDCGTANSGNFCTNCGTARPAAPAVNNCGNCGYAFPDPANPPKFCPNCGTKVQ